MQRPSVLLGETDFDENLKLCFRAGDATSLEFLNKLPQIITLKYSSSMERNIS